MRITTNYKYTMNKRGSIYESTNRAEWLNMWENATTCKLLKNNHIMCL